MLSGVVELGPKVEIGQHSETGQKQQNDDCYGVVTPDGPLLQSKGIAMAIADGVSASQAGKEASETCIKSFLEDYFCTHETWAVQKSAATVLCAINQWLHRQSNARFDSDRAMITTFSGLVLKTGLAHIFHVGDTRIALLRDNTLEPLTHDHHLKTSPDQNYLFRGVGVDAELEIDYRKFTVHPGDVFVFTTDGAHDYVSSNRILSAVARNPNDLQAAARAIVSSALQNDSPDNVTCQLVGIESVGVIDETTHLERLQALPFPPDLSPGMLFEGYRIESEVHASNRTQVYIARDVDSDARVIVKTPSITFSDDPGYIEMFMREEWAGKRIRSPNVVRVLEPKGSRAFLYYVTEYVDGVTLEAWMDNNPEPSLVDVRNIADQIAAGLRAFHRKDMIHQDLKPGNVVIDKHGTVKLIDFGSTGIAALDESGIPVELPTLVGTVDYTAPEYHLGQKPTNRSDIYSLGVIVYQMLTGKLPYGQGFTDAKSIDRLSLTPPGTHSPSLPYWVSDAISKAVQRRPEKRYDALSAFIADLARPNPEFVERQATPFLEQNPTQFWKVIAVLLMVINIILLAMLAR